MRLRARRHRHRAVATGRRGRRRTRSPAPPGRSARRRSAPARRCSASHRRSSACRSRSLTVSKGVVSGGGKTRHLRPADRRQPVQRHDAAELQHGARRRLRPPTGSPPGRRRRSRRELHARRDARPPRDRHPGDVTGDVHLRPERPRPRDAARPGRAPARPGRLRAPAAPIVSVDASSIAHIPDVQIVQKGNFLGVVAPNEYDAIQAAAQLKVTWKDDPILPGSGDLCGSDAQPADARAIAVQVLGEHGDVDAALASAAKSLSATLQVPLQHAPARSARMCCVADVTPTRGDDLLQHAGHLRHSRPTSRRCSA